MDRSDELRRLVRLLAPGAPRGGPLVRCPANDKPGTGVAILAVQAMSCALTAGWFDGGAMLVSPLWSSIPQRLHSYTDF
jgi:hypothetical protein